MGEILRFKLRYSPKRDQAKIWLKGNIKNFPSDVKNHIGEDLFHGWRFISSTDGKIYFANCIEPGIGFEEFEELDKNYVAYE